MAVELALNRCNDWAFIFALEREASAFRKCCPHARIEIIGVGAERAAGNVQLLIERQRPMAIVLAGYGGALRDGWKVGDVVVADEVVSRQLTKAVLSPSLTLGALRFGRIVSVDQIMGDSDAKRELGHACNADCVDMESYAVASVCEQNKVPWAVVRVISDTVDTVISRAVTNVFQDGKVSTWRAMAEMLKNPMVVREFLRLARDTRIASEKIKDALVSGGRQPAEE